MTVRIDEPGDSGSIHQQNDATAAATATVEADVASAGPVDTTQTAVAEAGASQIDVGNAVVTVRVGSGGDDGPVTQVNAAVAEAAAEATASLPTTETVVEALAQATQESVSNTTVSVRVFSPGDDGPISQVNEAAASASAVGGNELAAASATQDDVRNTNVAIRVESPGTSAPVEQRSQAIETVEAAPSPTSSLTSAAPRAESVTATEEEPTAPRPAVSVTTVANDTAVAVNVVGDQLGRPGIGSEDELVVWEWVWTWDRAEETDEIVATTDASSWTWDWSVGDAPGGIVTTRTATEAEQAGTWTWAWDWDREVPDWAWTWIWSTSLMCDSCAWVWDWDWSWTGEPSGVVGTDDGLSATDRVGGSDLPISADVVQRNGAVAESVASVVADVTQTSQQVEPIAGESFIGQLTDVVQTASAMTSSTQELGPALATDAASEAVVTTTANAELVAVVAQSAQQDAVAAPEGSVSQWIGQQAGVVQDSSAIATGAQGGVDTGSVSAAATSQGISLVVQDATQEALVDGGMATQWVGQLTLVDQVLDSASVTAQTGAADAIGVGSRSGAPTAVSVAVASDLSHVAQSAMQHASRANGVGEQTVSQIVVVEQVASSSAATAQSVGGSSSVTAAGSHAVAINRSLVEQLVEQAQFGLTPIEIQDSEQQVLVEQFAVATSTSAGSAGGPALVVNCSTVQQGAAQWIGVSRSALGLGDATSFCAPPSAAERRAFSGPPPSPDQATAVTPVAIDEAPVEGDLPPLHGSRFIPSADVAPSGKTRGAMAPFAPPVAPSFGTPSPQQLSAPPTPQARFDTRPGGSAGTEDTGREPLLPPVGGSPGWAAALAAAASAAGSSGIAAILFALALVPPLGLRVRNGSVVRRPASVLSWVDVPI